jgi:hypothetical protein
MRPAVIVGIVLIILGLVGLAYGGITYTARQTTVQVGPLEVTAKEKKTIPIPSIAGGILVAGGVILMILGTGVRR